MFNVNRKSNHMRTVNFSVDVNDSIVSKRVLAKAFKSADSIECRTSLKYFDSVHDLQCITYPDRKTQRQMEFARISGSYDHSKVISSKTNNQKIQRNFDWVLLAEILLWLLFKTWSCHIIALHLQTEQHSRTTVHSRGTVPKCMSHFHGQYYRE